MPFENPESSTSPADSSKMWPLDLPAREVLKMPGETVVPWAVFDPIWYLDTYPDALVGDEPADVLRYYLETGQKLGHSPNRMFDEQWHRLVYPQIAERIESGDYASAFDAYCRRGSIDRSPHWLFDELTYRSRYKDLTNEVLASFDLVNGYDHYLRNGVEEDRVGHLLFDPATYLSHFDAADIPAIRREGVFQHYLRRIESGEPELRTSAFFDPDWYLRRYPEVGRAIADKQWKCALHHYLCNQTPTAFDPLESFSESWYLKRDPGLVAVIASRHFRNGYAHFLQFGASELRSPAPSVDLAWYAAQPEVRADVEQGRAPHAFAHWLMIGAKRGIPSIEPAEVRVTEAQGRTLFQQAATALLPVTGRFGYRFACVGEPVITVVMVVRDGFATTMATIGSLRANLAGDIELVIIDRGSTDETISIGYYVRDAKILRFESDIGWARAADAGRQLARGRIVLFLSDKAMLGHGAIEHAQARLSGDTAIGAVGGLLIQPAGSIAQAGGIVWNNGGVHDYQRGASPLAPEAHFVRDVDFCSAAFLMVRAELLSQLDGFDHDCTGGYETIDLCLRIAAAGYRVTYDPAVLLFVDDTDNRPGEVPSHFMEKHAAELASRSSPGGKVQVVARHAGVAPRRILFIEDTVPLRHLGSGFVRSNDVVKVMAELGCGVTVFPVNGCTQDVARVYSDMPDTVEVMYTLSVERLREFLTGRRDYYDTIWVARTHNLQRVQAVMKDLVPDSTLLVLDTEAVTPQREAVQAELSGAAYDLPAAMQALVTATGACRVVVAVTPDEAQVLRDHGVPDVAVIGHMIEPRVTLRSHAQRAGILFIGAIHTHDSPNLDSLVWFVEAVLPLIEEQLGWETRLTIAGYTAPGIDLGRFENHPRITLRGAVADLEPLYNAHRVFVAPTRYAAGAPFKVFEAASRGLPVVATELLRRQLGWVAEQEILSATIDDPASFAAAVLALYRDDGMWRTIRDGALRRLRRENGKDGYMRGVAAVLSRT